MDFTKRGQNIVLFKQGYNKNIIQAIHKVIPSAIQQMKGSSKIFKGKTDLETCKNVWHYLKHNLRYVEDNVHFQDIKMPKRLVKDGFGDCKSYSIFACSVLENLDIPCKLAYTSYTDSKIPQHVYCQTKSGVIVDGVWNKFNSEKKYTTKYLKNL